MTLNICIKFIMLTLLCARALKPQHRVDGSATMAWHFNLPGILRSLVLGSVIRNRDVVILGFQAYIIDNFDVPFSWSIDSRTAWKAVIKKIWKAMPDTLQPLKI